VNKFIEFVINLLNLYHFYRINNYLINLKLNNFIDIGAHKGEFFEYFVKRNKFIKKVILIEPQKDKIINLLKINKELNQKAIIKNIAIGKKNKQQKLFINSLSSSSTIKTYYNKSFWLRLKKLISLFSLKSETLNRQEFVTVKTLDQVLKNLNFNKIDFVKIDVEGSEYEVLLSGKKSLNNINYILIEKQFTRLYKGYSFQKIEKLLIKKNFLLIKKFKFIIPFFEDRLYKKITYEK
jgi:FkbM family methyltransferase